MPTVDLRTKVLQMCLLTTFLLFCRLDQSNAKVPQRRSFPGPLRSVSEHSFTSIEDGYSLSIFTKASLPKLLPVLIYRGGSDESDDEDENEVSSDDEMISDEEDDESEDENVDASLSLDLSGALDTAAHVTQSTLLPLTKKALKLVVKVASGTLNAIQRAVAAGLESEDDYDEDEEGEQMEVSIVQKIVSTLQRMLNAAFTFPESSDEDLGCDNEDEETEDDDLQEGEEVEVSKIKVKKEKSTKKKTATAKATTPFDFGIFLSNIYGVEDKRPQPLSPLILGGSLTAAMQEARAQARLLVVLIPVEKYKKGKESREALAVESMLSEEVAEAANQAARKGEETGSFIFWSAKLGSSESTQAMKRLKAKPRMSKGVKSPILMVVYPAMTIDSTTGQSKMVPKVVAQHHCSPPPSAQNMANWLDSLRKRHGKQYVAMQTILKELLYFKERKEGYQESQQSDKERKKREEQEEIERLAQEKLEEERIEALEKRRKELLDNLPEEANGKDVKKVALRFADGRSGQRRFQPDQSILDMFNWVDAMFEMEREKVILTTLNGKQSLQWEDHEKSFDEAGLGKNTAFRVSLKEELTEEDSGDDKDAGDESESES